MISRDELLRAKRIASRSNPRLKEWAGLADGKNRRDLGLTLAEGARLVREGLDAPEDSLFSPIALLVSDSGAERADSGGLFARAGELGLDRYSLADDCFAKVSGLKSADGLGLVLSFSSPGADAAYEALRGGGEARWLVAAGVQEPGNAGALARTALAAGCDGCLFLDGADPFSPKFLRGGMGAAFRLPCLSATTADFAAAWPEVGARLVLAASGGGDDYREADYSPPWALAVGGEAGVPEELAALAERVVHIPLRSGVESLNLAVAAGVILFEATRSG